MVPPAWVPACVLACLPVCLPARSTACLCAGLQHDVFAGPRSAAASLLPNYQASQSDTSRHPLGANRPRPKYGPPHASNNWILLVRGINGAKAAATAAAAATAPAAAGAAAAAATASTTAAAAAAAANTAAACAGCQGNCPGVLQPWRGPGECPTLHDARLHPPSLLGGRSHCSHLISAATIRAARPSTAPTGG
eukprot:358334-Chlamydomonas_euryale.AAC.4